MPLIQPEVRGVGEVKVGTGSSFTIALPEGTTTGDLVLLAVENGGAVASESAASEAYIPTTPTGWTRLFTEANGNTRLTIFGVRFKEGVGSTFKQEAALNHTMHRTIAIKKETWKGSETLSEAVKVGTGSASGASKAATWNELNLEEELGLFLPFISGELPDSTSTTQFSEWTATEKEVEITERIDNTTAEGDGGALGAASYAPPSATKLKAGQATTVTSSKHMGVVIGVRPFFEEPKGRRYLRMVV